MNLSWNWDWLSLCPTGLTPWSPHSNDLAPCFQQLFLQLPTLSIFAISSSYFCGRVLYQVSRSKTQTRLLYLRITTILCLSIISMCKMVYMLYIYKDKIWPIDILIGCTEILAYTIHFGFLLSLRTNGTKSHRGPLLIGVMWILLFLLTIIWTRTTLSTDRQYWSITAICLHSIYALTLIPSGKAAYASRGSEQPLLSNAYIRFQDGLEQMILGPAQDDAPYLSKFLFYWVNPLINKGVSGYLQRIDDLFDLPESLRIVKITQRFRDSVSASRTLFKALHRTFGREFYLIGILKFLSDMSGFAGPILLGYLLRENSEAHSGTDLLPYLYSFGLLASSLLAAICGTHFNWRMALVTMKMRIGLVTAIYNKSLEAKSLHKNTPDILNLMATDSDRIVNSCISFHSFWSIPFQLFTTLYLLYQQIGVAFIAGVIFGVTLIPINRVIASKIGFYSQNLMTAKDDRISATVETISGAKHIKLLAWEDVFIDKIQGHRTNELKFLTKRKYLDALCVYFWATTPVLMCLLTFGVSVMIGRQLDAASTFASVALLNMLIGPLNAFPWVLNGLVEAWVSLKRVQKLFDLPNLDLASHYSPLFNSKRNAENPIVLSLKKASFAFDKVDANHGEEEEVDYNNDAIIDFKLIGVTFDVRKGDLICLEGPVGGGKSALLQAILGILNRTDGEICVSDINQGFGYVSQNHWLQRGTIRDNIVWGSVFDLAKYKRILRCCALEEDISTLGGDLTGVGENGRTLSGGQRARIALARAIYQNKQIYLLDDILSALDNVVANHIIKHCILGLLRNKTRIIVTENKILCNHATHILRIENGHVSPNSNSFSQSDDMELWNESHESSADSNMEIVDISDSQSLDSVMNEEPREYGTLSTKVFTAYWNATGGWLSFFVLLSVVLMQISRNLSDTWLAYWIGQTNSPYTNNFTRIDNSRIGTVGNSTNNDAHSTSFYMEIYALIAVVNSAITFARAFLFAYAGIKAAKYIHNRLLNRVLFTGFKFFDVTPLGRILNRFSSDVFTIDDSLPFILNIFLAQLAGLIGAIVISLYAMPWLALLIVPMCPIYLNLQNNYRYSSRDIKRLSSNALSPLYEHFTETLQGMQIIRAMNASHRFKQDFLVKLEECIRAQLTSSAAQQWLSLRLQLLGAFLVGGAGLVAAITSAHASSPEMVGLAISYALSITGLLSGVLSAVAETEQELVAVERVDKYLDLDPEINAEGSIDPPFGWPCQGVVSFKDVSLKYRAHIPPSLVDINFETASCERIGIVGRTGAGKSSLIAAIARIEPLWYGHIKIDQVNISTLPLNVIRNRIAFVPQEPFLFAGTIRLNMDPRGLHLDSQIWSAINKCLAAPLVQSLGGLDAQIDSGGTNLSSGQKQLLCLARALLKNSKIVCIDEGTSNLDSESEIAIQVVLRNAFKSSTVLFIAHRLNSLQHTDRLFVMSNARIVEEGTFQQLEQNTMSQFHALLHNQ